MILNEELYAFAQKAKDDLDSDITICRIISAFGIIIGENINTDYLENQIKNIVCYIEKKIPSKNEKAILANLNELFFEEMCFTCVSKDKLNGYAQSSNNINIVDIMEDSRIGIENIIQFIYNKASNDLNIPCTLSPIPMFVNQKFDNKYNIIKMTDGLIFDVDPKEYRYDSLYNSKIKLISTGITNSQWLQILAENYIASNSIYALGEEKAASLLEMFSLIFPENDYIKQVFSVNLVLMGKMLKRKDFLDEAKRILENSNIDKESISFRIITKSIDNMDKEI